MLVDKLTQLPRWLWLSSADRPLIRYLKVVFLSNPLMTGLFVPIFLRDGTRFYLTWGFSLIIATGATTASFLWTGSVIQIEGYLIRRQQEVPPIHGKGWFFMVGVPAMLPGMYLGALVAEKVFGYFGHDWKLSGVQGYFSGMLIGVLIFGVITLAELYVISREAERSKESNPSGE